MLPVSGYFEIILWRALSEIKENYLPSRKHVILIVILNVTGLSDVRDKPISQAKGLRVCRKIWTGLECPSGITTQKNSCNLRLLRPTRHLLCCVSYMQSDNSYVPSCQQHLIIMRYSCRHCQRIDFVEPGCILFRLQADFRRFSTDF